MNANKAMSVLALLMIAGCNSTTEDTTSPRLVGSTRSVDGPLDQSSGMPKSAVAAIISMRDTGHTRLTVVFYFPEKVGDAQLAAAPSKVCRSQGLKLISSEEKTLEHSSSQFSGAKKLVVRCKK